MGVKGYHPHILQNQHIFVITRARNFLHYKSLKLRHKIALKNGKIAKKCEKLQKLHQKMENLH